MGKRKAEDDEWKLFKGEIVALYEKHSLPEVMDLMNQQGFKKT